jgi:hypothetical protein
MQAPFKVRSHAFVALWLNKLPFIGSEAQRQKRSHTALKCPSAVLDGARCALSCSCLLRVAYIACCLLGLLLGLPGPGPGPWSKSTTRSKSKVQEARRSNSSSPRESLPRRGGQQSRGQQSRERQGSSCSCGRYYELPTSAKQQQQQQQGSSATSRN